MLQRFRHLVPLPIRLRLRELRRRWKRTRIRTQAPRSRADLRRDLEHLGLRPGDTVLVHSSLSRLGFVEGGAEAVIDALLDAIGPSGTLCMPSFPFDTYVADYLRANPSFDLRQTPS